MHRQQPSAGHKHSPRQPCSIELTKTVYTCDPSLHKLNTIQVHFSQTSVINKTKKG